MDKTPEEKAAAITEYMAQANGCSHFVRHGMSGMLYTSGVEFVAETAGAYWLIDAIASHRHNAMRHPQLREFQIWFLRRNDEGGASLLCYADTGKGCRPKIVQKMEYTDFPMREIKLYVENNTICLPAER